MAMRARQMAQSSPTVDQMQFRKSLASKSRKTKTPSASARSAPRSPDEVAAMNAAYTPTIGRRSTALYRLNNVSGQHPNPVDYRSLIEEAMKDP